MSIYLELTEAFNREKLRAVICSGQAVVLHRLAIMSKDGDWIVREDQHDLDYILDVLNSYGATYRFGAPLDPQWLKQGWSSHFEFHRDDYRVRTDFFTRPPRITGQELERLWTEQVGKNPPFTSARDLALIKMTQREKDYPVIGELARLMEKREDQLLYSRSAIDLIRYCLESPDIARQLYDQRPLLKLADSADAAPDKVAEALDAERRSLIKADAARLSTFETASSDWRKAWPNIRRKIEGKSLPEAHQVIINECEKCLPKKVK